MAEVYCTTEGKTKYDTWIANYNASHPGRELDATSDLAMSRFFVEQSRTVSKVGTDFVPGKKSSECEEVVNKRINPDEHRPLPTREQKDERVQEVETIVKDQKEKARTAGKGRTKK